MLVIRGLLAVFLFIQGGASARAASYCWFSGGSLTDGQTLTETLKIVLSSRPRDAVPGKSANRPWCVEARTSLGGHSESVLVERPTRGVAQARGYRIRYRCDSLGHDRFVIEHRWLNWANNQWMSGKIVYEIDVVDQPF